MESKNSPNVSAVASQIKSQLDMRGVAKYRLPNSDVVFTFENATKDDLKPKQLRKFPVKVTDPYGRVFYSGKGDMLLVLVSEIIDCDAMSDDFKRNWDTSEVYGDLGEPLETGVYGGHVEDEEWDGAVALGISSYGADLPMEGDEVREEASAGVGAKLAGWIKKVLG